MENSQENQSNFLPSAAQNGLVLGFISIIITMGVYLTDVSFMADWKFGIMSFLIFSAIAVVFGRKYRSEIGGYISYGNAFKYTFVMLLVSGLISVTFNILLYNVIDPDLPQTVTKAMLENQEKMLRGFGMSDDMIDQTLEQLEIEMPKGFSTMGQIKSSWAIVLSAAFFAAIASIFIKKNKPEFE